MMGKRPRTKQRMPVDTRGELRLRTGLDHLRRRIREATDEREAIRREVDELRRAVAEQTDYLDELAARVQLVLSRDNDLRAMLVGAHEQLMNRADEIRATLTAEVQQAVLQQSAPGQSTPQPTDAPVRAADLDFVPGQHSSPENLSKHIHYRRLIRRIRETARAALPPGATVLVVSKGDEELLELGDGRKGWHFPQNEEGVYAGYYPPDSARAISHLEELRAKGAGFLLLPGTALWWFEEYEEFGRHLDGRHRRVHDDEACVIYELSGSWLEDGPG